MSIALQNRLRLGRPLLLVCLAPLLLYILACLLLLIFHNRLLFSPEPELTDTPSRYGLDYQEVRLPIPVNAEQTDLLHGWWLPPARPEVPVVLYLHGAVGNIGCHVEQLARLHRELGLAVFLFDYRGFGESTGAFPSEAQVYADAERAWHHLVAQRGIDPRRILLYGHALGGAIAVEIATRHPEAAGLVLESSFTSAPALLRWWSDYFPLDWLVINRFDNLAKLPRVRVPVLVIHGARDRRVPLAMAERNYRALTGRKRLLPIPSGGHTGLARVSPQLYLSGFRQFVRELF